MARYKFLVWLLVVACFFGSVSQAQTISTIAGTGIIGFSGDDSAATAAKINIPCGIGLDNKGNIYFADGVSRIRKINTSGIITTIAGGDSLGFSGDGGPATAARLYTPQALCIDKYNNIYCYEQVNARVRKVDTFGIITTYCGTGAVGFGGDGGPATSATIGSINCIAIDTIGNLYLGCAGMSGPAFKLREINAAGIINTIAGIGTAGYSGDGGPATAAAINSVTGLCADLKGNIFFSDATNNRIRKIDAAGMITTYAGTGVQGYTGIGGQATAAQINLVSLMAADTAGNLYFMQKGAGKMSRISTGGIISWIAGDGTIASYGGDGGPATGAKFYLVSGVATDPSGSNIYVSDRNNYRVRHFGYNSGLAANNMTSTGKIVCVPNPAENGSFTITFSSSVNEPVKIVVTNVTGQKILELNTATNEPTCIALHAPSGVYFISAYSGQGVWKEQVLNK